MNKTCKTPIQKIQCWCFFIFLCMGLVIPKDYNLVGSGNTADSLRLKNIALGIINVTQGVTLDLTLRNICNTEGLSLTDLPATVIFIRSLFYGLGYFMNKS